MSLPDFFERTRQSLEPFAVMAEMDAEADAAPAVSSNTITFTMYHQQQTEWCWAAVSVSVSHFYNAASNFTQCGLVNVELNQQECCHNGSTPGCNQPYYLDRALQRTGNLRAAQATRVSFQNLTEEIENHTPLGCRIGWVGGGGHFVMLHGYSTKQNGPSVETWVEVADPWYGPSDLLFDKFATSYQGNGTWTHSYFTKA